MRSAAALLGLLAGTLLAAGPSSAPAQGFFKRFIPVKRVQDDPQADYGLTDDNGPWLIMASTFSGEGAQDQARELTLEFRQRFNLPAYTHAMEFRLGDEAVGRGVDEFGAPLRMRYRKGERLQEWAVLVGNFPSVDDPEAQKLLKTVKTIRPNALDPNARNGATAQSLAKERTWQRWSVPRLGKNNQVGPMRTAFMARNPLLPQEYFVPKGVDKFVEKMNRGVSHSLLDNPKRYTVRVATFSGQGVLAGASNAPKRDRGKNKLSPLEEAAVNAHLLTEAMRSAGFDAYEFHDRHESIVAVGGFDSVVQRGLDGRVTRIPEVERVFRTFGAAFNTPAEPLPHEELMPHERAKADAEARARLASFNQRFASQHGQIAPGLNPKFARIRLSPKSEETRVIPFDIHPEIIEAPKKSVSAGFAWRR